MAEGAQVFALSRDGQKVFLHQPDEGMAVPVLLDFRSGDVTVRVPSIDELEDDYVVYDALNEVVRAVDGRRRDQVAFARRFSRECSETYREQIAAGRLTIRELRSLVEGHHPRTASDLAVGIGPGAEEAVTEREELVDEFERGFTPS